MPNSFGKLRCLEDSYRNMKKNQVFKILRASSIQHQWVCLWRGNADSKVSLLGPIMPIVGEQDKAYRVTEYYDKWDSLGLYDFFPLFLTNSYKLRRL